MDFSNDNSTLISAKLDKDDLVLRVDISGWYELPTYEKSVVEIILQRPEEPEAVLATLNQNIDEFIWEYEFSAETGIFSLSLDNGDVVSIKCAAFVETITDLAIGELLHRYQMLSQKYHQESAESWKGWRNYGKLREGLTAELLKELGNWEEKLDFYAKQKPTSVEKAETGIKLCTKFINLIEQFHKDSNA